MKAALELNHISKVYGILLKILEEVNSNAVLDMDGRASKECSAASHWDCTKLTSTIPFTNLDSSNASTTNRFEEILVPLLLQEELLLKLLVYIKEWNTNAKYAYVCHMVLDCIISNVSLSDYLNLGSNSTNTTNSIDGYLKPINIQIKNHLEQSLASYVVYSERHYQRISKLNQSSYIIDYICNSMDLLTDFDNLAGGKASVHKDTENGDSVEEELQNDDVSVDDKPSIKKPRLSVF